LLALRELQLTSLKVLALLCTLQCISDSPREVGGSSAFERGHCRLCQRNAKIRMLGFCLLSRSPPKPSADGVRETRGPPGSRAPATARSRVPLTRHCSNYQGQRLTGGRSSSPGRVKNCHLFTSPRDPRGVVSSGYLGLFPRGEADQSLSTSAELKQTPTAQCFISSSETQAYAYFVHKRPPLVRALSQINSVHTLRPYSHNVNFNIIHPSTSRHCKWVFPPDVRMLRPQRNVSSCPEGRLWPRPICIADRWSCVGYCTAHRKP
jgi:hypothetical protein